MDLDNIDIFRELDKEDMYGHLQSLPEQLEKAWEMGQSLPLPDKTGLRAVVVTGMGGSAIGADLVSTYAAPVADLPVVVVREYDLPAWVKGSDVLVIASSHSGNTEETLSAIEQARQRGCRWMTISTGGRLLKLANEHSVPAWTFEHRGQPRAAVGYSFGLILTALARLGVLPDPSGELQEAVAAMREQEAVLKAESPVHSNPAKRLAGQLYGRWVTVMGSGYLVPVARRWKGQISEVAKAWAQFEALPEADHNTLCGIYNPDDLLARMVVIFLRAESDHPRNRLRADLTRRSMMLEGLGTDFIDAKGASPMAHIWTALQYGDYTAYYLAMSYGVDPTPIAVMVDLKNKLSRM